MVMKAVKLKQRRPRPVNTLMSISSSNLWRNESWEAGSAWWEDFSGVGIQSTLPQQIHFDDFFTTSPILHLPKTFEFEGWKVVGRQCGHHRCQRRCGGWGSESPQSAGPETMKWSSALSNRANLLLLAFGDCVRQTWRVFHLLPLLEKSNISSSLPTPICRPSLSMRLGSSPRISVLITGTYCVHIPPFSAFFLNPSGSVVLVMLLCHYASLTWFREVVIFCLEDGSSGYCLVIKS